MIFYFVLQESTQLLRYQWRDYIGECLHTVKLNKRVNLKVSTNARTSGARFVGRSGEPLQSCVVNIPFVNLCASQNSVAGFPFRGGARLVARKDRRTVSYGRFFSSLSIRHISTNMRFESNRAVPSSSVKKQYC